MERSCLLYKLYNIKDVQLFKVNTVKTVYKGQSQGITKVASVDRWPLLTGGLCSVRQKLLFDVHATN